jgi:hypothetical protein
MIGGTVSRRLSPAVATPDGLTPLRNVLSPFR